MDSAHFRAVIISSAESLTEQEYLAALEASRRILLAVPMFCSPGNSRRPTTVT
jgi:hypothetical protein